jgi:tRNA (guanine9-N1)-methyltransferase
MSSPNDPAVEVGTGAPAPPAADVGLLPKPDEQFTPTLWSTPGVVPTTQGGGSEDPAPNDTAPDAVPMSKNARKKAAKQAAYELKKAAKKAHEKQAKRTRGEEIRADHAAKLQAMTDDERRKYEESRAAAREVRKKEAETAKARKKAALTAPQRVVIDLEFANLMQEKERKSMAYQLGICYSANVKAAVPAQIHVTGLGGGMGDVVRKVCSGVEHWAVHMADETYLESPALIKDAKTKEQIVYLTADSEHELADFKDDEVYVIGGIVDRNRYKNLTLNKANEQGIRHARLPIRDHLKMSGTHVLTVNQTLDIIHAQLELRDWDKAMDRAVPMRKRTREEDIDGEGGAGGEKKANTEGVE